MVQKGRHNTYKRRGSVERASSIVVQQVPEKPVQDSPYAVAIPEDEDNGDLTNMWIIKFQNKKFHI